VPTGPHRAHHREMTDERGQVNRDDIAADLERARLEFHRLLAAAGPNDWGKPTLGTRWTNEQLLFHMVFGYMVVQRLLVLVRIFSRLPDPVSRVYANSLDATGPSRFTSLTTTARARRQWSTTGAGWAQNSTV